MRPAPPPVLIALLLAISSLAVMANATISPSLPGLAQAFEGTPRIEMLAGLVLALPSLSVILTAALLGLVLDRVSWKPVLAIALVVYGVGGAAAAAMDSMAGILISRLVLGFGVAALMTTVSMLAGQLFHGAERDRFMGWQAGAMSAGGIVFILAGGALAELSWRAPFLAYLVAIPFAVAALWMFRPLPGRFRRERHVDDSPFPWSAMALAGALGFTTMAVFYLVPTKLPFHMQALGITAPTTVALAVAALTLTATPGAVFLGALRSRLAPGVIFALCYGIMAIGYALIATAGGFGQVIVGTLIAGLGVGPTMPNIMAVLMAQVPPASRGRAAGLATTSFFAGQLGAPVLAGLVAGPFGLSTTFWAFAGALAGISGLATLAAIHAARTRPAAGA